MCWLRAELAARIRDLADRIDPPPRVLFDEAMEMNAAQIEAAFGVKLEPWQHNLLRGFYALPAESFGFSRVAQGKALAMRAWMGQDGTER
jgi:hypothetical protein